MRRATFLATDHSVAFQAGWYALRPPLPIPEMQRALRMGSFGGGDGVLVTRLGQVRLDLERPTGITPAQVGCHDRGHPRCDRFAPIPELLSQPGATGEDVVDGQGDLVADGPQDLCFQERPVRDESAEEVMLRAERHDRRCLRAVAGDERGSDPITQSGDGGDGREFRRDPVEGLHIGGTDQAAPGRVARAMSSPARGRAPRR